MLASTASDRKGAKIEHDISWFYPKMLFIKHQNKVNFKKMDAFEVLSSDFPGLKTSAASLASAASAASLALTALFHHTTSCSWCLDHPWHQNDQYWSLFVEWIIKNTLFHWYMIPLLSEAVEASWYNFFENCLMKLKCPNLLNPLGTIIQENYQTFYPPEAFTLDHSVMRHPVVKLDPISTRFTLNRLEMQQKCQIFVKLKTKFFQKNYLIWEYSFGLSFDQPLKNARSCVIK